MSGFFVLAVRKKTDFPDDRAQSSQLKSGKCNLFGIDRAKGKTSVEIGAFVYASSCVEISRIAFLEIVD